MDNPPPCPPHLGKSANCVIREEDIKNCNGGTYTTTTAIINKDKLSEKEKLVEDLIKCGAIDIKEALILLDKNTVEITVSYPTQPVERSITQPIFGGYPSNFIPAVSPLYPGNILH